MKSCLAILLLLAAAAAAEPSTGPGECAPCHPAAGVQWRDGVHAAEGMVCIDCHGGDAAALEAAAGHLGMRRFDAPGEIALVCGGCHAEVVRMRPYNLAVDQRLLYEQSVHGRARLAGDEQAPACTGCHLNHRVLAVSDPASPVFHANLPRTCGGCHEEAERMAHRDLDVGVVEGFSRSPHGLALQPGHETAPNCASCHDGHAAAIPLGTDVEKICGACHAETRASLRGGAHRPMLARQDLRGCASCHPPHLGLEARPADAICVGCHAEDSTQVALGVELERLMREAKEEVARAEMALLKANRVPLDVRDHQALINDSRDYVRLAGARFHTFQREPIEELTRASRSVALGVQVEIDRRLERDSARTALYFVWFYAAVTLGALARYRSRALRRGAT